LFYSLKRKSLFKKKVHFGKKKKNLSFIIIINKFYLPKVSAKYICFKFLLFIIENIDFNVIKISMILISNEIMFFMKY